MVNLSIDADMFFLFANAASTFTCGGTIAYLLHRNKLKKHYLFYFWSLGFFLYGMEIALRALSDANIVPFRADLLGLLMYSAFIMFPVGLWSLSHRKQIFYVIIPVYIAGFISFGFFIMGILPQQLVSASISSFFFYLPVTITLLDHRRLFGNSLDKIIIGWFLLFLLNLLIPSDLWVLDALAIFSKAIILLGILDYDFIILVRNIRYGLMPNLPPVNTGYLNEGGFYLIKQTSNNGYQKSAEWLFKKTKENISNGINSYISCFQDTIPYHILRSLKWLDPEKVFIFLFSKNAANQTKEFTVLPMGLTEIGAAMSEIIKSKSNSEKGCSIVITNLSLLIHVFGIYSCYNMLLSKMGEIRATSTELFAFIYPETHSDKAVMPLYTNISDELFEN